MSIALQEFLAQVREIDSERPAYRLGGDGSDDTCDCIGLVIGALRRAGGTWSGVHGSNWAARREVCAMRPVSRADTLHVGEIVFKQRGRGDSGWALPERYADDPDQRDYYHAGVVLSVDPLDIVHCTEPTTRHDAKLGNWSYAAELKAVAYDERSDDVEDVLYRATVTTEKDPLRVRNWPVTGRILGKVPRGKTVDVISDGEDGWPMIRYGELEGYASAQYLTRLDEPEPEAPIEVHPPDEADGSAIRIAREDALRIYDALADAYRTMGAALSVD